MPRARDGDYTLGELCSGAAKLGKQLVVQRPRRAADGPPEPGAAAERETVQIGPLLAAVSTMTFIRNQIGGHYNRAGADLSDGEVEELAERTIALVSALVCPRCEEVARKDKGSYHCCTCGDLQMFPHALV